MWPASSAITLVEVSFLKINISKPLMRIWSFTIPSHSSWPTPWSLAVSKRKSVASSNPTNPSCLKYGTSTTNPIWKLSTPHTGYSLPHLACSNLTFSNHSPTINGILSLYCPLWWVYSYYIVSPLGPPSTQPLLCSLLFVDFYWWHWWSTVCIDLCFIPRNGCPIAKLFDMCTMSCMASITCYLMTRKSILN